MQVRLEIRFSLGKFINRLSICLCSSKSMEDCTRGFVGGNVKEKWKMSLLLRKVHDRRKKSTGAKGVVSQQNDIKGTCRSLWLVKWVFVGCRVHYIVAMCTLSLMFTTLTSTWINGKEIIPPARIKWNIYP